jgi:nuclease S1
MRKTVWAWIVVSLGLMGVAMLSPALAWGPAAHAAIGELVEDELSRQDRGLRSFLARLREPGQRQHVEAALLGLTLPESGNVLRTLANWPDVYKRQPGMLSYDDQRHYVNLPHTARYSRGQHCPHGLCSLETLLAQRAILADRRVPLSQRAVALAWVVHLVGDMHQPLHAGRAEDRGGNLTCVVWQNMPSSLEDIQPYPRCSGENLHAVWDSKIITTVTGFDAPHEGSALARHLRPFLARVNASEAPVTARTEAQWRAVLERWHAETQRLILRERIYPHQSVIGETYIRQHYPTVRLQILRAAVRLAAMLRQTLSG